jgi:hypothetical protein
MRLPPKMTPPQIAEAQRMAREGKRLGASGKSRSEWALDERAAPRTGGVFCPAYGARRRSLCVRFTDIISMDGLGCGLDGQRFALPTTPQLQQKNCSIDRIEGS